MPTTERDEEDNTPQCEMQIQKQTSRQKQTVDTVSHIKQNVAQAKWCRCYHFPDWSVNIKVASVMTGHNSKCHAASASDILKKPLPELRTAASLKSHSALEHASRHTGTSSVQVPHTRAPAFTFRHKTHQAARNNGAHTSTFPHRHSFASFTDLCLLKSLVWISTDEKYSV